MNNINFIYCIITLILTKFILISANHPNPNIHHIDNKGYDLPLFIKNQLTNETIVQEEDGRLIPKIIWIAVKDSKDELPGPIKGLIDRNPSWKVNICDNSCKDSFIDNIMNGTSIKWAYHILNPLLGIYLSIYLSIYLYNKLYPL
jgi:hypothetical protein